MMRILQIILKFFARKIVAKYNPKVIGVTGSVGKTSAKEAIFAVLSTKWQVRRSIKNYNNELGLPLTIIGADAAGRSIIGWLKVFIKACSQVCSTNKNFPKMIILEMGVDRPGDMKYLNSIVMSEIAIITTIGQSHMEFFGSRENIQKEKGELARNLPSGGWAIVNHDDELARQIGGWTGEKTISFGLNAGADLRANDVRIIFGSDTAERGTSFKMSYGSESTEVCLPKAIGIAAVYAALSGAAVGIACGMKLAETAVALRCFSLPLGRMNLLPGINDSLIIDDTYNSSPQSVMSAVDTIKKTGTDRRMIAIMGDMLELGEDTVAQHYHIGQELAMAGFKKLVVVGKLAKHIALGAKSAGLDSVNILEADNSADAADLIRQEIGPGDMMLIKGSQGARMEKVSKALLADSVIPEEVLVRQGDDWINA